MQENYSLAPAEAKEHTGHAQVLHHPKLPLLSVVVFGISHGRKGCGAEKEQAVYVADARVCGGRNFDPLESD
tara:strand:+ start:402 stop:617 length:216 start_codon:yes stop_codon:yes gene_type:complete